MFENKSANRHRGLQGLSGATGRGSFRGSRRDDAASVSGAGALLGADPGAKKHNVGGSVFSNSLLSGEWKTRTGREPVSERSSPDRRVADGGSGGGLSDWGK